MDQQRRDHRSIVSCQLSRSAVPLALLGIYSACLSLLHYVILVSLQVS